MEEKKIAPVEPITYHEKSTSTLLETVSTSKSAAKDTGEAETARVKERELTNGLIWKLDQACLKLPPAFFSLNMGTGITSILLYNLPYNTYWLQDLGIILFILNIIIFAVLAGGNVTRYLRWKGIFSAVACHPAAAMFWGTLPMGFATIVVCTSAAFDMSLERLASQPFRLKMLIPEL